MYEVEYLIKDKGKTISVQVLDLKTNNTLAINKEHFYSLSGKLTNATVTTNGVIRGKNKKLKVFEVNTSNKKVNTYIIMHENDEVLEYDLASNVVKLKKLELLPFELRRNQSAARVSEWIKGRVTNLHRTYMNLVYIARQVDRQTKAVVRNSLGVSFTDNFWIRTNDISANWRRIRELRDTSKDLLEVALKGDNPLQGDTTTGFTSLFTTKGYFPKAIIKNYMYKNINDSILEYPASLLGKQLGIDVVDVQLQGQYIKIKLFTSDNLSLVHANQLMEYYDEDQIYNVFANGDRQDLMLQMQRIFIFNYIIGNPDLHSDNYGVLYNPTNFKLIKMAPCFDHNVAFMQGFNGITRNTMGGSSVLPLDELAKRFITNHKDIQEKIKNLNLREIKRYINEVQLRELTERLKYLLN